MPKPKDDRSYLWDMLEASRSVRKYIEGKSFHEFLQHEMLRFAVERKLEIIGEAGRHISESPPLSNTNKNLIKMGKKDGILI